MIDGSDAPRRDLGLTLAGGGNRAFWQLGVLRQWWPALGPRIAALGACSAGACMAVTFLSGREREVHEYWLRRRDGVTRNFEWRHLLRGRRPTPHYPIYRDTLLCAMADGGLERLRAQPFPVRVLMAAPPALLPVPLAVLVGFTAYTVERRMRYGRLHPAAGRRIGFRPVVVDLRTLERAEDVVDAVIASSSTPPFLPVGAMGDRPVLDGGLVDNAPAFLVEDTSAVTRNLVLLTRPYPAPSIGMQGIRLYLCPAEPTPVNRWDYTRPELIGRTIAQGEAEAGGQRQTLEQFLAGDGRRRETGA